MQSARIGLACLWLSQTARVTSDWCLRMFVLVLLSRESERLLESAGHTVTAVFLAPFILLAPWNGAISNGFSRRKVLVASCGYCLAIACLFALMNGPWLAGLGLLAAGTAIYSPTRYAMFPAAAEDGRVSLVRVNSIMEAGGAGGVVAGALLGLQPNAVLLALICSFLSLLAALPVQFVSDASRREPPAEAVRGFFQDARRLWRMLETRGAMLGLGAFLALVTAGSMVVVGQVLQAEGKDATARLSQNLVLVTVGVAVGSLLAGWQRHLRRGLGLIPPAVAVLLISLAWAAGSSDPRWPSLFLGIAAGVVSVPLRAFYQASVPPDARGNAMAISNLAQYTFTLVLAGLMLLLIRAGILNSLQRQLWFLAGLAGIGLVLAGRALLRDMLEQLMEIVIAPIYRIHGHGPGMETFPLRGPVIVLGNHASWCDPLWVAKIVPRRLFPMMTSLFFDRPVLHWLMTRVVHAIRVPASFYRREAPELQEAIAVLDRDEVLLLFPEGMLRRKDDLTLRVFGQGIWRILRDRPHVPIVTCWIEGGWGSYMSYKNGPPLKNKRPDFWRPILIGISEPFCINPAILDDHRATRNFLMQACLNARKHLGLDVPTLSVPEDEPDEPDA